MNTNKNKIGVKNVKTHEKTVDNNLRRLISSIQTEGLQKPIIIDKESQVVLDGHHRLEAFRILGLRKIPVVEVDYLSEKVELESRRSFDVTKKDVIEVGKSDLNFPAKTTKHRFKDLEKNFNDFLS